MVAVAVCVVLVWLALSWNPGGSNTDLGPQLPSPDAAEPAPQPQPSEPALRVEPKPAKRAEPTSPAPVQPPAAPAHAEDDSVGSPPVKVRPPDRLGPVDALKAEFDTEPRASTASELEALIEGPLRRPEAPAGLFKSVLCRTSVCKIETRWTPDRAQGFLATLMQLVTMQSGGSQVFEHNLGISPEGEPAADGTRAIDVYLKRIAPATPQ